MKSKHNMSSKGPNSQDFENEWHESRERLRTLDEITSTHAVPHQHTARKVATIVMGIVVGIGMAIRFLMEIW